MAITAAAIFVLAGGIQTARSAGTIVPIATFSKGALAGWQSRSFRGETKYTLVSDRETGATVLEASAERTSSGRFRKIRVDLLRTPFLNWSWKATGIYKDIDESTKAGDDFPARIYVIVERGLLGTGSISLNYVWASQHPVGATWPSPYTDHVRLLAVDAGPGALNKWITHKRNVRADLEKAFGKEITAIDDVALMSDADDHGGTAVTRYGDIWFSSE